MTSVAGERREVRVGVRVPCVGEFVVNPGIAQIARLADDVGVDTLWVNDHLVMPSRIESRYPFGSSGEPFWAPEAPWYEAIVTASVGVASSRVCDVGIAALVLPQRNLITVSKAVATLDALSGGRFILGVAAGWLEEEMTALGYDFPSRGKRLEAMVSALRETWTGRPGPIDSPHCPLPADLIFEPKPASPDSIPIMVGGMSGPAIRRAANLGDGWLAFSNGDESEFARLGELLARVRELRPDSQGPLRAVVCLATDAALKSRLPLIAEQLADLGFDEIAIDPPWTDLAMSTELIRGTMSAVRPGVR